MSHDRVRRIGNRPLASEPAVARGTTRRSRHPPRRGRARHGPATGLVQARPSPSYVRCGVGSDVPGRAAGGLRRTVWAARANPTRNSEAASRRSVFDRVPLLSDLKLCLLRSCQAPRAAPTLPLLRFWAGWGWGCGTSGCGCGMRLEGLGVALLRSSANLIT